jgi:hypothetical protein
MTRFFLKRIKCIKSKKPFFKFYNITWPFFIGKSAAKMWATDVILKIPKV